MEDHDHIMSDVHVVATTEYQPNGPLTLNPSLLQVDIAESLDPSILHVPYTEDLDALNSSPEADRSADTHNNGSKIPRRQRNSRSPSLAQDLIARTDPKTSKSTVLPYSTSSTGLVYDVRMRFHVEVRPEQNHGVHPEDPRRIFAIYRELIDAGLVEELPTSTSPSSQQILGRVPVRLATKEEICAVHSEAHYEWVIGLSGGSLQISLGSDDPLTIYQSGKMTYCTMSGQIWTRSIFRRTLPCALVSLLVAQ